MSTLFPAFPPELPLYEVVITDVDPHLMIALDDWLRSVVERFQGIMAERNEAGAGRQLQEQVVTVMQALETTYTYVIARLGAREAAEEAVVYRRESTTITLELPAEAAVAGDRFLELLDDADEYCRTDPSLQDVVSTPAVAAFRKRFMGEIVRQLREIT